MSLFKSQNIFVNTVMLPGSLANSSYGIDSFRGSECTKLIYIPFRGSCSGSFSYLTAAPSSIPALLVMRPKNKASKFCIHFHGNACDAKQIHSCAMRESRELDSHYLVVEYPRFGISNGHPNELVMNEIASTVYYYVVNELRVHFSRIVLIGRSIGSGPVCTLASDLEVLKTPVAAIILQSPYTSIRDAASDILGCISLCILDRWVNWMCLVGTGPEVIRSPILFIHADNDKIVNCSHSKLLHEHRLKYKLSSEIFIQKSTERMTKGHNIYEYEKDVVVPSKQFLQSIGTTTATPITLDLRVIEQSCTVPAEYLKRYYPEIGPTSNDPTTGTAGTTTLMTGTTNSSSSSFNRDADANSEDLLKKNHYEGCLVCSWCMCCCSFCVECCVALNYQLFTSGYHRLTCSLPIFNYSTLRPQELKDQASISNIFRLDRFDETAAPRIQQSTPIHAPSITENGAGANGKRNHKDIEIDPSMIRIQEESIKEDRGGGIFSPSNR